jgi:aspartate/methionine/tyrosine aminotransferase
MIIKPAKRLDSVKEYYFSSKLEEVALLKKQGKPIINLGIGSPDLPPPYAVIEAMTNSVNDLSKHAYQSYQGLPELRQEIANFYKKHYAVSINFENEILPLMGAKEGVMHISMAFLNAGDAVLIPNPGYITYASVAKMLDAKPIYYDLNEANGWFPDLDALEQLDLENIKIMWLNYPHMPTGTSITDSQYKALVAFAQKHQILLINDNPYSFILNDKPKSILAVAGAKEVAIELNSLSKTFNMAGWRVGFLSGNEAYIKKVLQVKSNMDSGMFYGIQQGAIAALKTPKSWLLNQNAIYKKRRKIVWKILDKLACSYDNKSTGLFVWAKLPKGISSEVFCDKLLYDKAIFIAPGAIFGTNGTNYVRVSLCVNELALKEVLKRVKK